VSGDSRLWVWFSQCLRADFVKIVPWQRYSGQLPVRAGTYIYIYIYTQIHVCMYIHVYMFFSLDTIFGSILSVLVLCFLEDSIEVFFSLHIFPRMFFSFTTHLNNISMSLPPHMYIYDHTVDEEGSHD